MYERRNDILYQAASVWNHLTEYQYIFTFGYKKQLHTIQLTFSPENFSHLAGFQYLRDLSLPSKNPKKIIAAILNRTLKDEDVIKGIQYDKMVRPRLEALVHIKNILDNDFKLFSYMPRTYPFTTNLKADFIISSHQNPISFFFILRTILDKESDYNCSSAFIQEERNYETNQRPRTILKKERIHIKSNTSTILFDRLSSQNNNPQ